MQIQEFFSKIEESPTLEIVVIDEDHVLVEHKQGTKPTFKVSAQAIQDHEWFDLSDYLCERRELKVLDHMTRVCGYFSKVKNWNKGKRGELKDRRKGNYQVSIEDMKKKDRTKGMFTFDVDEVFTQKDLKQVVALDCETFRISPESPCPKVVCCSFWDSGSATTGGGVKGNHPKDYLEDILKSTLQGKELVVGHNIAFDLACIAGSYPKLIPLIWDKFERMEVTDTKLRKRLQDLSTKGVFSKKESLAYLVSNYLGEDISDTKGEDTWRLRYCELDGMQAEDYPKEAYDYALNDARYTYEVWEKQEVQPGSRATETFQTACAFALHLMSLQGIATDPEYTNKLKEEVDKELDLANFQGIIEAGILIPAKPGEPYKKDPTKFKKGTKEKVSKKKLQTHIKELCKANKDLSVEYTEKNNVSTSKETLEKYAPHSTLIKEYLKRQASIRLRTTELPILEAPRVYPGFDVLKRSGRTSSFAQSLLPSLNVQNQSPRIRPCYVPDEGYLFCTFDYSYIELVAFAQKLYDLFGQSTLKDLINDGGDPHAFLGAQLAYHLDTEINFKEVMNQAYERPTKKDIYKEFLDFKNDDVEKFRKFYKHWRTFAKPTGLGYPGGLMYDTFVTFAKSNYGVDTDVETAKKLREVWLEAFPEAKKYFDWVQKQKDPKNPGQYKFTSNLGMVRANASYCAISNNAGMQTDTGEGAKAAVFDVVRECLDESKGSILYGCKPAWFVHDEIGIQIPIEGTAIANVTEKAERLKEVMVSGMQKMFPDVKVGGELALMRRWYKEAEEIRRDDGTLVIWEPKDEG